MLNTLPEVQNSGLSIRAPKTKADELFLQCGKHCHQVESAEQAAKLFVEARNRLGFSFQEVHGHPFVIDGVGRFKAMINFHTGEVETKINNGWGLPNYKVKKLAAQ